MVKIISGFSGQGGSTESFINLTNELNCRGHETVFYGPHDYHLDKCNSGKGRPEIKQDDSVIFHYIKLIEKPICKVSILSSHESDVFPLKETLLYPFDKIHFLSEWQRSYHGVDHPNFICGDVVYKCVACNPNRKSGGIVGTIMENKQTHKAIEWALEDNCEQVFVFGNIGEQKYYEEYVKPLLSNTVIHIGWVNKDQIYNRITDFYHCSKNETYGMAIAEAQSAGKKIHIPDGRAYKGRKYEFDVDKIIDVWVKELKL